MWYALTAIGSTVFGFLLCALLCCGKREDERTAAREYFEARQHEMCQRCREMDEERADAREEER